MHVIFIKDNQGSNNNFNHMIIEKFTNTSDVNILKDTKYVEIKWHGCLYMLVKIYKFN